MKVKVRNIKNKDIVKEIDSSLLGDYLATKEWEKVETREESKVEEKVEETEESKPQEQSKSSFGKTSTSSKD